MRGTAALLVFSVVGLALGTVSSTRAADNGPIGTPSAADLAQLKALGLDPKDPDLRTKLAANAQQRYAALLQKLKGEMKKGTFTLAEPDPRAFDLEKALASLETSAEGLKKITHTKNAHPVILRMSSVEGSVLAGSATSRFGSGKLKWAETFYLSGTNLLGTDGVTKVTGDFGNCGTLSMPTTYLGSFTPAGSADPVDILQVTVPAFNLDEPVKDGSLTLSTNGGYFTIKHVGYIAPLGTVVGNIYIGFEPFGPLQSHLESSTQFLGMIEGQTMETNTGGVRASFYPAWIGGKGGSGTDEFGEGINLEHGWSATAIITQGAPDSLVNETPQDGIRVPLSQSLKVLANWSYPANSGSVYTVQYVLKGPSGGVPLSNMPQQTDCAPVNFQLGVVPAPYI